MMKYSCIKSLFAILIGFDGDSNMEFQNYFVLNPILDFFF